MVVLVAMVCAGCHGVCWLPCDGTDKLKTISVLYVHINYVITV